MEHRRAEIVHHGAPSGSGGDVERDREELSRGHRGVVQDKRHFPRCQRNQGTDDEEVARSCQRSDCGARR